MNGVPPQKIRNVYGAAKIYETYVGSKKFEPEDMVFSRLRQLGGEYGATTGRPRQCNWLDVDRLMKAARINGITSIVMSKMDVLRDLNKWRLYQDSKLVEFDSENEMKYFLTQQLKDIVIRWSDNPETF
jgi:adenylosuccinate synthase